MKEVGYGRFGRVYNAKHKGKEYAVKEIHCLLLQQVKEDKQKLYKKFVDECHLIRRLKHPNVVQLVGMYCHKQCLLPMMVMELMHANLTTYLEKSNIRISIKLSVLNDVATGLCFLHAKSPPIVHRNLYSNNILLKFIGKDATLPVAKISDLGLANVMPNYAYESNEKPIGHFLAPEIKLTPEEESNWAPEIVNLDTSLDIFSFAGIVLHIFSQEWPIPLEHDLETCLLEKNHEVECRQVWLDKVPSELKPLVVACLSDDPACRPSAEVLLDKIQVHLYNSYMHTLGVYVIYKPEALRL